MSAYADLIVGLQQSAKAFRENTVYDSEGDPLRLIVQADENDAAAAAISRLEREKAIYREALEVADAAIAEMFRYFDGGEMRGSYDGKPERNQLRKAGYLTRQALSRTQEQSA